MPTTLAGIVTLVKPVLANAFVPIISTPSSIVTLFKFSQPSNALLPIFTRLLKAGIFFSFVQEAKALSLISLIWSLRYCSRSYK